MVTFSVILPCYNKEDYIEETIMSILNQTDDDYEVIIVDDGSTDKSVSIIESFSSDKIKLIKQKNAGVSQARNTGIENAKGKYIAFIDADDKWLYNHLEAIKSLIKFNPNAGIYCTRYRKIKKSGISEQKYYKIPKQNNKIYEVENYFIKSALGDNLVWTSSTVVPRDILKQIDGFPKDISRGEDRYVWGVIALSHPVLFLNTTTADYRIVDGSLTSDTNVPINWIFEEYIEKHKYKYNMKLIYQAKLLINSRKIEILPSLIAKKNYSDIVKIIKSIVVFPRLYIKVVKMIVYNIYIKRRI